MKNVLLIGIGSVAKTLLELWNIENYKITNIIAIDPIAPEAWVFKMYPQLKFIECALTNKNMSRILTPILTGETPFFVEKEKPYVFDLSVEVDCCPIMRLCKKYGNHYINTSIEDWGDHTPWILDTSKSGLIDRSLYKRQMEVQKILKNNKKSTLITNSGMNPGLVSSCVKKGLFDYAISHGSDEEKMLARKGIFNELACSLGLEEIHISEIDTQIFKKEFYEQTEKKFFSTWSAIGYVAESLDPIQIGLGSNRDKNIGVKPTDGDGNVRIFPIRGMSVKCKSVTLGLNGEKIQVDGRLIPHAESDTLNAYLTFKH